MNTKALKDDIVLALADIEKAELLLKTYDNWKQDDLYIGISQNFIISAKSRILEIIMDLEDA